MYPLKRSNDTLVRYVRFLRRFSKTAGIMEKQTYIRPEIEVTEICIERGFAVSSVDGDIEGFDREEWG